VILMGDFNSRTGSSTDFLEVEEVEDAYLLLCTALQREATKILPRRTNLVSYCWRCACHQGYLFSMEERWVTYRANSPFSM